MANIGDVAAGIGSTLTDYSEAKSAQAANQQAYQEHLQDRAYQKQEEDLSLQERTARLAALRQAAEKSSPEYQMMLQASQNQKLKDTLAKNGMLTPELSKYIDVFGAGNIPYQLILPPKPDRDPKMAEWEDITRQYPEMNTPENRASFFGIQKIKPPPTALDIALETARVNALQNKSKATEDDKVLKKRQENVRSKLYPAIQKLNRLSSAVDEMERLNTNYSDLIGPVAGRLVKLNPRKTAREGQLLSNYNRIITAMIQASGAGSRGFTRAEQDFFKQMSGAITNSTEQNRGIIDDMRQSIDAERKSYAEEAYSVGIDPDELIRTPTLNLSGASGKISKQSILSKPNAK